MIKGLTNGIPNQDDEELGLSRLKQMNELIEKNIDCFKANLDHIFGAEHENIPAHLPLLIRAYAGGAQSEQYGPFTAAILRVRQMFDDRAFLT